MIITDFVVKLAVEGDIVQFIIFELADGRYLEIPLYDTLKNPEV